MTKELDQANDTVSNAPNVIPGPTQAEVARKRGLQTLVQSLGVDLIVAVAYVVVTVFTAAEGWQDIDWSLLAFLVVKSLLLAAASWAIRRFLDKSGFGK